MVGFAAFGARDAGGRARFLAPLAGASSSLSLLSSESRGPFSGRAHAGRLSALGSTGSGLAFSPSLDAGTEAAPLEVPAAVPSGLDVDGAGTEAVPAAVPSRGPDGFSVCVTPLDVLKKNGRPSQSVNCFQPGGKPETGAEAGAGASSGRFRFDAGTSSSSSSHDISSPSSSSVSSSSDSSSSSSSSSASAPTPP